MEPNQVICGDWREVLASLPDDSVDAVITDVPYGMSVADWDAPDAVNPTEFLKEARRVSRDFIAFFGQMPSFAHWAVAADELKLNYLEHVTWAKRNNVPIHGKRLTRTHEEILIYGSGKRKLFYQVRGPYEDVALPGLLVDAISYEAIKRYISALISQVKTGKPQSKTTGRYQTMFGKDHEKSTRFKSAKRERARFDCNYSNLWSFQIPSFQPGRHSKSDYRHPNEKPVAPFQRLIEMCSPPGGLILDPFAGSGTAAEAALESGRQYICSDRNPEYVEIMKERIVEWHTRPRQHSLPIEVEQVEEDYWQDTSSQIDLFDAS